VALVIDAFGRFLVGWQAARSLRTDLALDAWRWPSGPAAATSMAGAPLGQGSQYLAIRYTERLAEAGAVTSVGSRGDS
jgi:putative transposase